MTAEMKIQTHLTEIELADFMDNSLSQEKKRKYEEHLAGCDECLAKAVAAYESVNSIHKNKSIKRKGNIMKRINLYLFLAIITFALSFLTHRYFIQLLVATLLLGIKWIVDAKSTKMLVMIYEAWKNGGEKEASRIIETLDMRSKSRF